MFTRQPMRNRRAFTLIELLVVIAIIAILAAILFPVFATVRESARQSNTISSLHDMYVGTKLYEQDEGHFPSVLFPYAEVPSGVAIPSDRPALPTDPPANILPMNTATGNYATMTGTERGFLYHEQVKDYVTFANSDNVGKKQTDVTGAYWPLNSLVSINAGGTAANPIPVVWTQPGTNVGCPTGGDSDVPGAGYLGKSKLFYVMDSMDIGPMLDSNGKQAIVNGAPAYELHYSADWTYKFGAACDTAGGSPVVTQLKYQNPPADRTIITYVTQHVATAHSNSVIVLLLSGTTRKIDYNVAAKQLPLNYAP